MKLGSALAFASAVLLIRCDSTRPTYTASTPATTQPAAAPTAPRPRWYVQDPSTNPIDGVKTQFISLDANENSRYSPHKTSLVLTFENDRLAGRAHAPVRVDADGVLKSVDGELGEYSTLTRVRFDDEQPSRQTWGIADDHKALFARNSQQFLVQLLHHKRLAVEFSYYGAAPQAVTFDLYGLADDMKAAGLRFPHN